MVVSMLCNGHHRYVLAVHRFLRSFTCSRELRQKPLPPRIVVSETDITESFLKGSGPGGQKINKTSSAVQLKHLPTGIVVKSQETRSREQNRKTARRILGEKLEELEKGAQSRTALKTESQRKKKASAAKKARRKYRTLAEAQSGEDKDFERIAREKSLMRNAENGGLNVLKEPSGEPGKDENNSDRSGLTT